MTRFPLWRVSWSSSDQFRAFRYAHGLDAELAARRKVKELTATDAKGVRLEERADTGEWVAHPVKTEKP